MLVPIRATVLFSSITVLMDVARTPSNEMIASAWTGSVPLAYLYSKASH